FLDLNMPVMTGNECLRIIREMESLKNVPVVVLSSSAGQPIIHAAYNDGAHLFLTKPFDEATLRANLSDVVSMDWSNPQTIKEAQFIKDQYRAYNRIGL
ncbi:MAG: response regulator, partial [Chitinophagaceae bacterium]|nr:response regulator [Chitinophagaceae bacterium]